MTTTHAAGSVPVPVPLPGHDRPKPEAILREAETRGRFDAFPDLRAVHSWLLARHVETSRGQGGDPGRLLDDLERFLRLGAATGVVLVDEEDRRWDAQGLLDYWYGVLYRAGRRPERPRLAELVEELLPTLPDEACPYLGLETFQEEHAGSVPGRPRLFYGREGLLKALIKTLRSAPLLAVVGSSGSGKSSVVRAGLIPAVRSGELPAPGGTPWTVLGPMLPGADPLGALARLVLGRGDVAAPRPPAVEDVARLAGEFRADPRRLAEFLDLPGQPPVVLIVDQFEEVFTLCTDTAEADALIANLVALLHSGPGGTPRHRVVLTMRDDYVVHVLRYKDLHPLFDAGTVTVKPLKREELREAIERPAEQVGLVFEKGVVEALIEDTYDQRGALPLLQFTLLELWKRRRFNTVTMEAYRDLGGSRKALGTVADRVYEDLKTDEKKEAARRIFLRIVRPTSEGLEVTSRRIPRRDLFPPSEDHRRTAEVLAALVAARLIRATGGPREEDRQVEVAHEALVRNWTQLGDWLSRQRVAILKRQHLEQLVADWVRRGRRAALLDADQLRDAEAWIKTEAVALGPIPELPALVAASRSALRWRRIATGAGAGFVLVLLVTVLGWFGWFQYDQVRRIIPRALVREVEHLQRARPDAVQLRVLLAAEAFRRLPEAEAGEARRALLENLALLPAPAGRIDDLGAAPLTLAISRNGTCLAIVTEDRRLRVYRIPEGERPRPILDEPLPGPPPSLTFSPDGRYLVAAGGEPPATVAQAGSLPGAYEWVSLGPLSIPAPKDAAPAPAPALRVYDLNPAGAGNVAPRLPVPIALEIPPAAAMYLPARKGLYFADWDGSLWRVTTESPGIPRPVRSNPGGRWSPLRGRPSFGPDGSFVLVPSPRGSDSWSVLHLQGDSATKTRFGFSAQAAVFSPDGSKLALSRGTGVLVWDLTRDRVASEGQLGGGARLLGARLLGVSPDGRRVAVADVSAPTRALPWSGPGDSSPGPETGGTAVRVFDAETGREMARAIHEAPVTAATFSPDGRRLFTAGRDRVVRIWRADFGIATEQVASPDRLLAAAYSPDGSLQAEVTGKERPAGQVPVVAREVIVERDFSPPELFLESPDPDPRDGAGVPKTPTPREVVVEREVPREVVVEREVPREVVVEREVPREVAVVRRTVRSEAELPAAVLFRATTDHRLRILRAIGGEPIADWPFEVPVRSLKWAPDGSCLLAVCPAQVSDYEQPSSVFQWEGGFEIGFEPPMMAGPRMPTDPEVRLQGLRLDRPFTRRGPETCPLVAPIAAAAVGPGGARVAAATWGTLTTLVALDSGVEARLQHSGPPRNVPSPDGSRLATVDWDNTVRTWSVAPPRILPLATITKNPWPISSLTFSADGAVLALGGGRYQGNEDDRDRPAWVGGLRVLKAEGGAEVQSIRLDRFPSTFVLSPDGTLLAAADYSARVWTVKVWEVGSGSLLNSWRLEERNDPRAVPRSGVWMESEADSLAFSPDGASLALALDESLRIAETRGAGGLEVVDKGPIHGPLTFSRGGTYLAALGRDGVALAWGVPSRHLAARVSHRSSPINALQFDDEETVLFTAGVGEVLATPLGVRGDPESGPAAARGSRPPISLPTSAIPVDFSADGRFLTVTTPEGVRRIDLRTGAQGPLLPAPASRPGTVEISGEGQVAIATSPGSELKLYRAEAGRPAFNDRDPTALGDHEPVFDVAFSPDGSQLAAASLKNRVVLYRASDGQKLGELGHGAPVLAVAFSPGGRYLAGVGADGRVPVWDVASGRSVFAFAPGTEVTALAFSHDQRHLAAAGADRIVRVWQLESAAPEPLQPVARLDLGPVAALSFDAEDRTLMATGLDHIRRTLPWSKDDLLRLAAARSPRNLSAAEWGRYFHALPYERTFAALPRGPDVTDAMAADPRRAIAGLLGVTLLLAVAFLLIVPAAGLREAIGGGAWVYVLALVPLVAYAWSLCAGPILRIGAFAPPNLAEKLILTAAFATLASACGWLQDRLVEAVSPVPTASPQVALANWWMGTLWPRLAHLPRLLERGGSRLRSIATRAAR